MKFSKQANVKYTPYIIKNSQDLYIEAISLSKDIYALKGDPLRHLENFKNKIPNILYDFIYTSKKDKYTWMASHPKRIRDLADKINKKSEIDLIIGAAHGSIMPATLLSNIINSCVYFIRFSQFKRKDNKPIISESDMRYLSNYKKKYCFLMKISLLEKP